MSRVSRRAPALRCLLVWSAVTTVTAALLLLMRQELVAAQRTVITPSSPAFAPLLTAAATLVLGVCTVWIWCVTTAAVLEAAHGIHAIDLPGARGLVRRLALGACGVALAATAAPAGADDVRGGVAGQPPQPVEPAVVEVHQHTVVTGDSLWQVSEDRLRASGAATPSDAEIDRAWRRLWRANRDVVGPDPDRLEPGQRLELPEARR